MPGPKTLTKSEFYGTPAGKKKGSSYAGYLSYVARRRAAKLAQPADPFAQMPQATIDATVNRTYGQPLSDAQIGTTAQGMLDPVVSAITSSVNARAKAGADSVKGYTDSLAQALGGVDYAAPYREAGAKQAAVDEALRASLAGQGGALSADLQSRLAQIQDPAVAAAGGNVAGVGNASGNAELARGSASLSAILANEAAAKSYGGKLPGIARTQGLQDLAGVEGRAQQDIRDQTAQVTSQLPSIVGNLRSERDNVRGNRANLLATLLGQNITKSTAAAGFGIDQAKLGAQAAADAEAARAKQQALAARTRISEANAAIAAAGLRFKVATDARDFEQKVADGKKPNAALSRVYGHLVDADGNPILNAKGKLIPVAKTSKSSANPFDNPPPGK